MAAERTIQFVLDGKLVELDDVPPDRTVLQFLREDRGLTGSKEGCAEGDCGACTVIIAEQCDGTATLRPVNSCIQFLPTLHGRELLTVESLQGDDGSLHPVQQALVEEHGSQCGFCTPGFVMSLYALYESNAEPSRRDIDDALAGNLCRCTGYRPIVAAARSMYAYPKRSVTLHPALLAQAVDGDLELESDGRRFFAPASMESLLRLRAEYPGATLLAGGTDVGLWVTKQHRQLSTVIYTGRVPELQSVQRSADGIEIGAAVSLTDAANAIIPLFPGLRDVFARYGSPPIRNAGTLGGNVANGSPIGDSMPWLIAVGATLVLRSVNGRRALPLEDFYLGYMNKDLRGDEIVERIVIPLPSEGTVVSCYKLSKRFDQDISGVCAGFRLDLDGDTVRSFRMACGGMAATVHRATNCEAAVSGADWNEQTIERARRALDRDFAAISDMRASAGYRRRALGNLLSRFYLETRNEYEGGVYSYGRPA